MTDYRCTDAAPDGQNRANGSPLDELDSTLEELATKPQRNEHGQFVKGNVAAGRTLSRSRNFWDAMAPAKAALVERLESDLALDGKAAATMEALMDGFAEASLLRRSLFIRMARDGGALADSGKKRAAFSAYLQTLDREHRLAQTLGLERRQRGVTLAEHVRRKEGA